MKNYEIMYIVRPTLGEDELKKVAGFVDELIKQVKKNNPYLSLQTGASQLPAPVPSEPAPVNQNLYR